MHNRALHFITNRKDGFASAYFPASSDFQPCTESAAAKEVRRLLGLNSDYGVRAVLATVHGFPYIFEEFRDTSRTYRVSDFQPDRVVTVGAVWKNDAAGLPLFTPECTELPVPEEMVVEYLSNARARLTYGERVEDIDVRPVFGTSDLIPEWPEDLGVSGSFLLQDAWQAGSRIRVQGPPARYPWAAAGALLALPDTQAVLQSAGLLDTAAPLNSPVERVAVIALALAKQHPDFDV